MVKLKTKTSKILFLSGAAVIWLCALHKAEASRKEACYDKESNSIPEFS